MTPGLPLLRPGALVVVLFMAGVAALGFYSIRKDVENLHVISRDNILWSATQMEVELLRFQRSLALYASERGTGTLDEVHERFDILWSRLGLISSGRVGQLLRQHDEGYGTLRKIADYLDTIDPLILGLGPDADMAPVHEVLHEMDRLQTELRAFSLRVVRGDTAAASMVRERIVASSQVTAGIALGTLAICLVALFLIARENARQREVAAVHLRQAEAATAASRAKSRFLSMISHELRNPLNGVLGPLALIGQSDVGERQVRLIERAQQSGRIMSRMLRGLLDYGDIEDGRLALREEPFRPRALAEEVRAALADAGAGERGRIEVTVADVTPDIVWGDPDRLAQIFVYLGEYALPADAEARLADSEARLAVAFSHSDEHLVGEIAFPDRPERPTWKLDLLAGLGSEPNRGFAAEALGPLIAQGLLRAAGGIVTLAESGPGTRVIRVMVPARRVAFDRIRIHVETRSAALETLYRAALKSDRVAFVDRDGEEAADVVLVDSTSVAAGSLMQGLRKRFPGALFVSLGLPSAPGLFDEIVDRPNDIVRLRQSVLARLAS